MATIGAVWTDNITGCEVRPVGLLAISKLRKPELPPLDFGDMVTVHTPGARHGSTLCTRQHAEADSPYREVRAAHAYFAAHPKGAANE